MSKLLSVVCLLALPWMARAADAPAAVEVQDAVAPAEADLQRDVTRVEERAPKVEHGLPQAAVPVLNKSGRLPITNSMVVTWVVAAALILFARRATRRMQAVPAGAQNFWVGSRQFHIIKTP